MPQAPSGARRPRLNRAAESPKSEHAKDAGSKRYVNTARPEDAGRRRFAGLSAADVLASEQLRDDRPDPLHRHRVVLADVLVVLRRVHAHELALEVDERAARVALVDDGAGLRDVLVRADRHVALALARDG